MEDSVLEKIAQKIAENYDAVKSYYYNKSDAEILADAKKLRDYGDGNDVFIKDNALYAEINFRKFRVTTILNYIFHGGNLDNIVGIKNKNGIKLYEKFYPYQLRRMMMGEKLHEIAEKYASTLDHFSIEEKLSAEIDGDIVVGRLDLAHKDKDKYLIIDIKTGKLHEDLAKLQLAVYAHMFSLKHNVGNEIEIAVISPEGILKDVIDKNNIRSYLYEFIQAKKEVKKELSDGKFYTFEIN